MNTTEIFATVSGLVSISASLAALIIAWRKAPAETRQIDSVAGVNDADTAGKYQQIADRAAERALQLDQRIIQLERRVIEQAGEIERLKSENERLTHWARRLVHQVRSLGGDPVPMPNDGEIPAKEVSGQRQKTKSRE